MISLGSNAWGSGPKIDIAFSYEKKRSGADMQYRVNVSIYPLTGSSYFGYPIYLNLNIAGSDKGNVTLKNTSPSTWTSAITYTSPWYTVANLPTGTAMVTFRIFSGSGSQRDYAYTYAMASDPAFSRVNAANGTLGVPLDIVVTRYNPKFTHTIYFICGDKAGYICKKSSDLTVTWTVDTGNKVDLASQNTSGESVPVDIWISTLDGDTVMDARSITINMAIPTSVKPSLTLMVVDPTGYGKAYGGLIPGWSKLEVSVIPILAYGSQIDTCTITVDGKTFNSNTAIVEVIEGKDTVDISARVTDKRGRSSDVVRGSYVVWEYYKPSVDVIAYRCDSSGAEDPGGAYMIVGFTASVADLDDNNEASYQIEYSDGITTDMIYGDGASYRSEPIACDLSRTWNVKVTVMDNLDKSTRSAVIPIAFTLMDFYNTGKGIAFGKVATRDGFDCAMDAYFTGNVRFAKGFVDGSDTGWIQLSTTTKYRCKNGYVTVVGASYGDLKLTVGDYTLLGTLPVEYRPAYPIPMVYHKVGGDPSGQSGFVDNDGTVRLYAKVDYVDYWAFAVTYPI